LGYFCLSGANESKFGTKGARNTMVSQALYSLVESCVTRRGAQVIDLVIRGEKGTRVVEVFIDAEQSVTSDLCTQVAREISEMLDDRLLIDGPYRLTVSSPGLDRPLSFPWQYGKHLGRMMQIRVREGDSTRVLQGALAAAQEDGIELRPAGHQEAIHIPFEDILEARVKVPW